jgi:hypothetical protein
MSQEFRRPGGGGRRGVQPGRIGADPYGMARLSRTSRSVVLASPTRHAEAPRGHRRIRRQLPRLDHRRPLLRLHRRRRQRTGPAYRWYKATGRAGDLTSSQSRSAESGILCEVFRRVAGRFAPSSAPGTGPAHVLTASHLIAVSHGSPFPLAFPPATDSAPR